MTRSQRLFLDHGRCDDSCVYIGNLRWIGGKSHSRTRAPGNVQGQESLANNPVAVSLCRGPVQSFTPVRCVRSLKCVIHNVIKAHCWCSLSK